MTVQLAADGSPPQKKSPHYSVRAYSDSLYASARTVTGRTGDGNNRGDQTDSTHGKSLSQNI
ncbi:hypothetical protein ACFOGG_18180 [Brenneria rubrifaciens]|uniref:hypothetical protein n=1 Tax=Brenneria rubrifaciens TaxID=55213 RepID=UPI0036083887